MNGKGPKGAFRREASDAGCPTIIMEGGEVWKVEPGIVAIEWAQRLLYRPSRYLEIHLTHQGDRRQAELQAVGGFEIDFEL